MLVYREGVFNQYQLEATLLSPAPARSFGKIQDWNRADAAGNFTLVSSTGTYLVPSDGTQVELIYS